MSSEQMVDHCDNLFFNEDTNNQKKYRSIEFNLKVGCPIKCVYCPQTLFLKSEFGEKKYFDQKDFSIILNNASYPDCQIEVFFAGMSEPLSEKKWLEFATICENHSKVSRFVVFTTGYRLDAEMIQTISAFKKITVKFHVNEKKYMPNFDEKFWELLPIIKQYIPRSVFFLVGFDKKEFDNIIQKLKRYNLRFVFQKIISRSGNLNSVGGIDLFYEKDKCAVSCEKMHQKKRPVILPDGTALACCNDYGCEMKIGNLLKQTWNELDFQKIINMQKNYNSDLPCFKDCHFAIKHKNL
jgi:hypothetical protein